MISACRRQLPFRSRRPGKSEVRAARAVRPPTFGPGKANGIALGEEIQTSRQKDLGVHRAEREPIRENLAALVVNKARCVAPCEIRLPRPSG